MIIFFARGGGPVRRWRWWWCVGGSCRGVSGPLVGAAGCRSVGCGDVEDNGLCVRRKGVPTPRRVLAAAAAAAAAGGIALFAFVRVRRLALVVALRGCITSEEVDACSVRFRGGGVNQHHP